MDYTIVVYGRCVDRETIMDNFTPSQPKYVSLFSGGMGLDLGLEAAGFSPAVCVENDKAAVQTIRLNRPNLPVLAVGVEGVTGPDLLKAGSFVAGSVPLVVGGPPCQAFSVIGNRKGLLDGRGQLLFEFVRIVNELRPDVFVMENVRGLLSMSLLPNAHSDPVPDQSSFEHGSLVKHLFKEFFELGYRVDCFVVNAVNYGAPQIRERLIFIGNRHGLLATFPQPQFSNRKNDCLPPLKTLGDVIGSSFKDPCPEIMDFSPRKLRYLSMVPPGGNWRSLPLEIQKESMGKSWFLKGGRSAYWRKLSFAFPSPTVVTMPNHAGTSMCHPTELRAITVGEAAAIQEFPATWRFVGSTAEKFRQIGNAVPVRLGQVAGEQVEILLERIRCGDYEIDPVPQNRIVHLRPHVRTRSFWKDGETNNGNTGYYDSSMQESQLEIDW